MSHRRACPFAAGAGRRLARMIAVRTTNATATTRRAARRIRTSGDHFDTARADAALYNAVSSRRSIPAATSSQAAGRKPNDARSTSEDVMTDEQLIDCFEAGDEPPG